MRTVGHYRLKSLIGHGASSDVYEAEHAMLGDVVAIKLLRRELADDGAQALALVDEGAKVRAIDHPNVVRVLDAGIDPETHGCYLVMEHVAGGTLSARLRREGPLVEAEVRRLGAAIADGVAAAHARGIVHRDLKPANVMLDGDRPKIVDFGIAKHLGAQSAVTTGRMIGTLAYMAPEQLASGMIAPCTDVWALGVILFEMIEGHHPFDNFDDGRCAQLFDEPARAKMASPELARILARCLLRDPARRPSADELARLLRGEIVDDERITADAGPVPVAGSVPIAGSVPVAGSVAGSMPVAGAPLAAGSMPRSRRTWWFVAAGVVVAGAIGGVLLMRDDDVPAPPPSQPAATFVQPPVIVVQPPAAAVSTPPAEPPRPKAKRPTKKPPPSTTPTTTAPRETLD